VPIYVLVLVALAWSLRARAASAGDAGEPAAARGLLLWSGFIVLVLFGLTFASFAVDRRLLARERHADLRVQVTGKQWWWQVAYPDADPSKQLSTANELHLPVDRTARIEMQTADVIHSLWMPRLAGKLDLVPGRRNVLWVTPRKVGVFRGQCAEFCGLQHAQMALEVEVHDAAGYAAWRARQLAPPPPPATPLALAGQQLFLHGSCAMCHAIAGTTAASHAGPDLSHLASRRTLAAGALPMSHAALRAWLEDPQAAKPGTNMPKVDLDAAQLDALVAYLETLR
jgi:cytochrome c oxidase subunit 2